MSLRWVLLLLIGMIFSAAELRAELILTDSTRRTPVGAHVELYTGLGEETDFYTIKSSSAFVPFHTAVPNLGIAKGSRWLRVCINNQSNYVDYLLEIAYPLLDEVELFIPVEGRNYNSVILGEHQPFSDRKYQIPNYVFDIHVPRGALQYFYIRVRSTEQVILPIHISSRNAFFSRINTDYLLNGIYIGIVLIMAIYNFFLFLSVRDKSYLYYVIYVVCAGVTQMGIKGYSFQYLWPNWPEVATIGPIIFGCLSGLSALLFADAFLQVQKNAPRSRKVLWLVVLVFIVCMVTALTPARQAAFLGMQLTTGAGSLVVLFVSYRIMIAGFRPARFFVLGWTVLLAGSVVFLLKDYGILPYNEFTGNSVQIASVIEMALLSFGLAYSINILKKESEESQARALSVSLENERLIREQNVVLEQKVQKRTQALQASNASLEKTLVDLKEAQSQLVEAEKMASLGQLTAGIAHEINNPINFVTANVAPLKRDIAMVWDLLSDMERVAISDTLSIHEKRDTIVQLREDADVEYLQTEVDFLLKGMHDGASRTAEIVKSLRIFSRVDEDTLKFADLNEGLESTLVILNSILQESIVVNKIYGALPKVECYAGKLNQVFLNIISNAVYAIHARFGKAAGGTLHIKTGVEPDEKGVYVKIADNGIGIPADIRDRIFEPFFTTKEVGEGTGLGMSIAYNTIAKHRGKILLDSTEGTGTTFTLIIPIEQP